MRALWDDEPRQSGCKSVLTLQNGAMKEIFILYFHHSGPVLGQGEYWYYYSNIIFPQLIKNVTQSTPHMEMKNFNFNKSTIVEDNRNGTAAHDNGLLSGSGSSVIQNISKPTFDLAETNPGRNSHVTITPEKLQETLTTRMNEWKGTPVTPHQVMKKNLMKTTDRVDNLEEAMVQIREQQNFQDDKFKQILQNIDSLKCPDI